MKIEPYINMLLHNELFNKFKTNEILSIFNNNFYGITSYKKGNIIYFEGEKCDSFDLILEGEVYIQKIDESGNVLTIAEFKRGDDLGGNLIFSKHSYYPMTVIAKTSCKMLQLKKPLILDLCQKNRDFLIHFLVCISDKTMILTNKIKSISLKSIRESIIDYLNYEYLSQKSLRIMLNMTKKELAERLGIQRTSLSRELQKMKKEGIVDYDPHSITIIDQTVIKKMK